MKKLLLIALKLALSGSAIGAIAWTMLTLHPDGEVETAQADIVDMFPGILNAEHRFGRMMDDTGMKPRTYDINGNVVHFAVGSTAMKPLEVLDFYQSRLVREGINKKKYTDIPQERIVRTERGEEVNPVTLEAANAMLLGEVVPIVKHPEYVAMGGIVPKNGANNIDELVGNWKPSSKGVLDLNDQIEAFRFIDAQYDEAIERSTVTATWSDHNFNAHKMEDAHAVDVEPDANIPSCIGCKRRFRMASLNKDEDFVANQFVTPTAPHIIYDFYRTAMLNRGWDDSETQEMLDKLTPFVPYLQELDGKVLNFERDGRHVSIFIAPDDDGQTSITAVEGS